MPPAPSSWFGMPPASPAAREVRRATSAPCAAGSSRSCWRGGTSRQVVQAGLTVDHRVFRQALAGRGHPAQRPFEGVGGGCVPSCMRGAWSGSGRRGSGDVPGGVRGRACWRGRHSSTKAPESAEGVSGRCSPCRGGCRRRRPEVRRARALGVARRPPVVGSRPVTEMNGLPARGLLRAALRSLDPVTARCRPRRRNRPWEPDPAEQPGTPPTVG